MTNAEKYKEVFGLEVDPEMCPTTECELCPCGMMNHVNSDVCCISGCTREWWKKEYKEVVDNGKKETT